MRRVAVALALHVAAAPAWAVEQGDWPCIQRKVPEITAAAIGAPAELAPDASSWRQDDRVLALVHELAARRLPIEEAEKKIAAFATESDTARAKLPLILAGLLDRLNAERNEVITGIERYGHKQKQLAGMLRNEMQAMDKIRADKSADPQKLTEANDKLAWDTRIFDDRQKSLSYVCEVPVLIEQRMFALGRAILAEMK